MDLSKMLCHFLDSDGKLVSYPAKRKMKLYALLYLASKFEAGKHYSEMEINAVIGQYTAFHDPATLRRELCDYRFLERQRDCSSYWLNPDQPTFSSLGLEQ